VDSYDNLVTAIADWLDRSDLSDRVDTFIDIAEARHAREVRIREMLDTVTLTLKEGETEIELPENFLDFYALRVRVPSATTGRKYIPGIEELTVTQVAELSFLDRSWPRGFAVHEVIEFTNPADRDYEVELLYYAQLPALSKDQQTNALLTKAGDVYLYAALAASAPFLLNDERVQMWEALYAAARDGLNRSSRESRRGGPLVSRVHGATP